MWTPTQQRLYQLGLFEWRVVKKSNVHDLMRPDYFMKDGRVNSSKLLDFNPRFLGEGVASSP